MADAIRALHPAYVIIENVPGLATKMGSRPGESALGTVVADLAEAGYVGSWIRLRASEVGAPHRRERIFVIAADPKRVRIDTGSELRGGSEGEPERSPQEAVSAGTQVARTEDAVADSAPAADTRSERFDGAGVGDTQAPTEGRLDGRPIPARPSSPATDTDGRGRTLLGVAGAPGIEGASGDLADGLDSETASAAYTDSERRTQYGRTLTGAQALTSPDGDSEGREWGIYAPAVLRWERILGRSAPRPTDDRGRLNPEFTAWMLGFPPNWVEGENRTQQLRMLGNAVQVQCGEVIGRMLQ